MEKNISFKKKEKLGCIHGSKKRMYVSIETSFVKPRNKLPPQQQQEQQQITTQKSKQNANVEISILNMQNAYKTHVEHTKD